MTVEDAPLTAWCRYRPPLFLHLHTKTGTQGAHDSGQHQQGIAVDARVLSQARRSYALLRIFIRQEAPPQVLDA